MCVCACVHACVHVRWELGGLIVLLSGKRPERDRGTEKRAGHCESVVQVHWLATLKPSKQCKAIKIMI